MLSNALWLAGGAAAGALYTKYEKDIMRSMKKAKKNVKQMSNKNSNI
ncbi:MAG: hypothetical protein RR228_02695 [Bacilli bacterium]